MTQPSRSKNRHENKEARAVVEHAFAIAQSLEISKVIVCADPLDIAVVDMFRGSRTVLWLTANVADFPIDADAQNVILEIPAESISRSSQVQLGIFLAVTNEHVAIDETVLCLSGGAGSDRVDSILVTNPRRDFPWFKGKRPQEHHTAFRSQEFARLVEISLRLSAEGREGKSIGTIFVLGDPEELEPHLKQLVLNPCAGHGRKARSIHNEEFIETVREFAAMDGAFVVGPKGVVESAGTYLDASVRKTRLPMGLGARHAAAAAVTAATDALSVVISESSGSVTVFLEGKAVLTLSKPS